MESKSFADGYITKDIKINPFSDKPSFILSQAKYGGNIMDGRLRTMHLDQITGKQAVSCDNLCIDTSYGANSTDCFGLDDQMKLLITGCDDGSILAYDYKKDPLKHYKKPIFKV
jgi:WD40 repeat protein